MDTRGSRFGPGKSAGAGRSRPVQSTIVTFQEKHGISKEQWEEGNLRDKLITELPLHFSQGLTKLDLRPALLLLHKVVCV